MRKLTVKLGIWLAFAAALLAIPVVLVVVPEVVKIVVPEVVRSVLNAI